MEKCFFLHQCDESKKLKSMKKIILNTLALLFSSILFAQNNMGEIKGTVYDENDETVISALVYVRQGENKISTMTDTDGNFTIKPLPSGTYNVVVDLAGNKTFINGVIVDPDKITWLKNIKMGENIAGGFTVTTYAIPLIKPEDPTAQTISAKMIEHSPLLRSPKQLIGSMSSEIQVSEAGDVYVRGSRNDAVNYYIDGVKSTGMSGVPGSAIGSITVYTGGVPAKYGDVTGGVVILETKSYFSLYNRWKANH